MRPNSRLASPPSSRSSIFCATSRATSANRFRFACFLLLCGSAVCAQSAATKVPVPQPPDPAIASAVKQVSPERIRATIEKLVSFGNRNTLSSGAPDASTSGHGIVAARKWIQSEFEQYSKACNGCLQVQLDRFSQPPSDRVQTPTEIVNVYAILPGTDPARAKHAYLVSGHYDSRNSSNENTTDAAPGANDDASGTAVSLECARVLSRHRFPTTLIFLSVAGEEQGLYGSAHFAKWLKDNGWQIEGMLNNDIVGGDRSARQDTSHVRVFSEGIPAGTTDKQLRLISATGMENDSPSRELARYVAETAREYLPTGFRPELEFRRDRYLRGGDHISFNEQGFAAVRFTEYRENFNHQHQNIRTENGIEYGDMPKFVDFGYAANVARLNAATLARLASAPAPPANVKLLMKQLENDTQLAWDASPGAAYYEVLWRAGSAPDWEHAQKAMPGAAGEKVEATLPVSKDNVVFAVRAVDTKGHRSLPVVPQPER